MGEAMVTGRMAPGKKRRGGLILQREGLTASQAINRMYDRLIENGDASFLTGIVAAEDEAAWDNAVEFVDSLSEPGPQAAGEAPAASEAALEASAPSSDSELAAAERERAREHAQAPAAPKPAASAGPRFASKPAESPASNGLDLGAIARAARFSMRGVI